MKNALPGLRFKWTRRGRKSFCFAAHARDRPPLLLPGPTGGRPPPAPAPLGATTQNGNQLRLVLQQRRNDDKKRSLGVARPLLCSARIANRDAAVGCWVEESFYYVRTRHERPSRPSRVVKELMAALMRFPAAVYQFSFVNVAPFFPPSVGYPRAPGISILGWS